MARFAVIGHPIGHTLSPILHTANFCAIGFDGTYGACDVAPDELAAALRRFVAEGYLGINCTIPHKEAVLPLMTRLDAARHSPSTNTASSASATGTPPSSMRAISVMLPG